MFRNLEFPVRGFAGFSLQFYGLRVLGVLG